MLPQQRANKTAPHLTTPLLCSKPFHGSPSQRQSQRHPHGQCDVFSGPSSLISWASLAYSAPATPASLPLLKDTRHISPPGPLHWLLPLPALSSPRCLLFYPSCVLQVSDQMSPSQQGLLCLSHIKLRSHPLLIPFTSDPLDLVLTFFFYIIMCIIFYHSLIIL